MDDFEKYLSEQLKDDEFFTEYEKLTRFDIMKQYLVSLPDGISRICNYQGTQEENDCIHIFQYSQPVSGVPYQMFLIPDSMIKYYKIILL